MGQPARLKKLRSDFYLLQWLQDLVPLDRALTSIFQLILLKNKMSLPAPKTQPKDLTLAAMRHLLLSRLLFYLLFFFPPKTYSQNL